MNKREMLNLVSKTTMPCGAVIVVTTDKNYGKGMSLAEWLEKHSK